MKPLANTYRFFVPPEVVQDDTIRINDAALARQLSRVLRLQNGDRVLLLDGVGTVCTVVLTTLARDQVIGQVVERSAAGGEALYNLTLYPALLRAERFEWLLQKGVELGVQAFVPVACARSLSADRADERKLARWRRIMQEAAEQACRGRLPDLHPPQTFAQACTAAAHADLALLLWEGTAPALREIIQDRPTPPVSIAVVSGPEGGITPDEWEQATAHGLLPVSLGPRILRAETAPLAAAAAFVYLYE